ncbi:serine/threonine protein kinase [Kitasatospora sp. MAP12-15]|uniref:class IV lanthionine synthetase LanL n=1 Tax=unclassified Kitasatospora TaxID=2633591 RepID=UPI00247654F1|nr:class IV lanthionine synthetase LanL [Kitasatospora sp. MAP12-44]MDH6110922.1 serine/threonine protein kinase [Kitasatospora sp. MAP12-44]
MELYARLAELTAECGRRQYADDTWLYLQDPKMPPCAHGWKLHLSTRPDRLAQLMERVVPVLLRYTCDVKFAVDAEVLRTLNAGRQNPAAVGKAATVYPRAADVAGLGAELAQALVGWAGPRVVSDRQVRPDAPVYYRYGPFRAGDAEHTMAGPDGSSFPGLAEAAYRQPPWARDPFPAAGTSASAVTTRVGDGRYRITAGIARAAHGHVYRAVEVTTGRPVVVKQARAHVAEDHDGVDARGRLRRERQVLTRLAGVDGVPEAVDYFRHGEDEYLVSTDCGPRDLRRDVLASGPYCDDSTEDEHRSWRLLAQGLLRILDDVHARGVVLCDLKPDNVVIDPSGGCRLVDFGVSALDGRRPGGATPGYGLPPSLADPRTAQPADDYYALGATLSYASTGLDPVVMDPDPVTNRARTLACLAGVLPDPLRHPARTLIAGLLSLDAAERTAAAERLRSGRDPVARARRALPSPPLISSDLLDDVIGHTLAFCVRAAREQVAAGVTDRAPRESLSLYQGSAGLGLELLRHPDDPDARAAVAELARWTAAHPARPLLPPALYEGRTGVDLFLAEAAETLGTEPPDAAVGPDGVGSVDGWFPAGLLDDQIAGAAGIGTGHLLLAERARAAGREPEAAYHRAVAAQCARGLLEGRYGRGVISTTARPGAAAVLDGAAHGRAGVAHFLLAHHHATGDPASGAAAEQAVAALAAAMPGILAAAARPGATRRYGSWCRGLAGIGPVLLRAGVGNGDERLVRLSADAARACRALAPRMSQVVQCCGLSGVGELLLDVGAVTGDVEFRQGAEEVAALILTRSGGPPRRPVLPDTSLSAASGQWAGGSAGVLSFLRRLRQGGPRLGPA